MPRGWRSIAAHAPAARLLPLARRLGRADAQGPTFAGRGRNAGRARRAGIGLVRSGIGQARPVGRRRQESRPTWSRYVGSWRAKTTWEMLDLALDGNVPEALRQVDRLLASGEVPIGLLGQISSSLRRLAAATHSILRSEAAGARSRWARRVHSKRASSRFCICRRPSASCAASGPARQPALPLAPGNRSRS